jgi:DNA-binding HxlR family transcriptional regulator
MYSTIIQTNLGTRRFHCNAPTGSLSSAARQNTLTRMPRTYSCPVELALEVLGGKWRVVLLAHLKEGPLRYSDLRRLVPTISEKILTQRLHELRDSELIAKRGNSYSLTRRGRSASGVLQSLYDWGEALAPELDAAIVPPKARR